MDVINQAAKRGMRRFKHPLICSGSLKVVEGRGVTFKRNGIDDHKGNFD